MPKLEKNDGKDSTRLTIEYLLAYGWTLLVVAIVVSVLMVISSAPATNVFCNSHSSEVSLESYSVSAKHVQLQFRNSTGLPFTQITAAGGGGFFTISEFAVQPTTVNVGQSFSITAGAGPISLPVLANNEIVLTYMKLGQSVASTARITCLGAPQP